MKKELYKNIIKRLKKGSIYLAVLISITVASVMSMVSMRKNIISSIEQDTQKMFTSNSETIDNVLPVNNQTVENEQDKKQEKISYVTYEEKQDKQSEEQLNNQAVNQKQESNQSNTQEIPNDNSKEDKKEVSTNKIEIKENVPKSSDIKEESTNNSENKEASKEVFFQDNKSFIVPLAGEIINDFSDDKLIYSKTLDEWRVHQGIDITAKEGTNVKAVLDGYVEEIKNDDEYGVTVVVRHSKSLVSVYKNLANEIVVLPNQIIKQGDVVGLVGNTGKIETDLSHHLHFEMLKNNKLVDPKIYIQFKKN